MLRRALSCLFLCGFLAVTAAARQLPPENTGLLYVASYVGDEVAVYDESGAYLRSFAAGGLNGVRGIVVAPDGMLYVASQLSNEIFLFDADEQHIGAFQHPELSGPTGMALGPNGLLYVSSYSNDRVVVFDLQGNYQRHFTSGSLNGPNCVAFDSGGRIYVSSALTASVVTFAADETPEGSFTGGGLASPMGIARDGDDVLYVAGGTSNNIVLFDTAGTYLGQLSHPDLTGPQGIVFDDRGHLFSTSFFQDKIVEFDADLAWVRTITDGGLDVPRSMAFQRLPAEPGAALCFGDGSAASCPCGNDSPTAGEGCVHSAGHGMTIAGGGGASATADDLVLHVAGCPPGNSGIFYCGTTSLDPGSPLYGGLQCAGGDVRRFQGLFQNGGDAQDSGFGAQDPSGVYFQSGTTYYFQYWSRDVNGVVGSCGTGANFSPAYAVTLQP